MLIIPITEEAYVKMVPIDRYTYDYNTALQVVGVLTDEVIQIEQPIVVDPIESNDMHWTPIKTDGEIWTLSVDNNAYIIPGRMLIRVNKPASPGNPFGIAIN